MAFDSFRNDYRDSTNPWNPQTLFHLVPLDEAVRFLYDDNNTHRVSYSSHNTLGLEVGYHFSKQRSATVITRIGRSRSADLVLADDNLSKFHLEFQVHPLTFIVLLKILRTGTPDVTIMTCSSTGQLQDPDHVLDHYALSYGQPYRLCIRDYEFQIAWCGDAEEMLSKVEAEYEAATIAARNLTFHSRDTVYDKNESQSYRLTRIRTGTTATISEDIDRRTGPLGLGGFGTVWRTVDKTTGEPYAVKVIEITDGDEDEKRKERERIHREVKAMKNNAHSYIIELVHVTSLCEDEVWLYMPLKDGSLSDLVCREQPMDEDIKNQVLHQVLMGLDFLSSRCIAHRDLKPQNILYTIVNKNAKQYRFQLADFGLAREHGTANSAMGTNGYMAPETFRHEQQGSAVDIWALGMTMICLKRRGRWPPRNCTSNDQVYHAVRTRDYYPEYNIMYRESPSHRPSAAQCLVQYFDGAGRTTKDRVPPIPLLPGEMQANQEPPQGAKSHINPPDPALDHFGPVRSKTRLEMRLAYRDRVVPPPGPHARSSPNEQGGRVRRQRPRRPNGGRPRPRVDRDNDVIMGGMDNSPSPPGRDFNLRARA